MTGVRVYVDAVKVRLRFQELGPDALDRLDNAAASLESELVDRARDKASGAVLQVRTGKYVANILGQVRRTKQGVSGKVFSKDERADLFEFGGKTHIRDIVPNTAQAMLLQVAGGKVFAKHVLFPGGDYGRTAIGSGSRGKYSTIFAAFDEMRAEIFTRMRDAATGALKD